MTAIQNVVLSSFTPHRCIFPDGMEAADSAHVAFVCYVMERVTQDKQRDHDLARTRNVVVAAALRQKLRATGTRHSIFRSWKHLKFFSKRTSRSSDAFRTIRGSFRFSSVLTNLFNMRKSLARRSSCARRVTQPASQPRSSRSPQAGNARRQTGGAAGKGRISQFRRLFSGKGAREMFDVPSASHGSQPDPLRDSPDASFSKSPDGSFSKSASSPDQSFTKAANGWAQRQVLGLSEACSRTSNDLSIEEYDDLGRQETAARARKVKWSTLGAVQINGTT